MFLPKTFRGGGYEVTINVDRSINVRQGDWLSKYSMAIYGDFNHIDKFWRKKGSLFEEIKNKDLISVGETLYHPDPLPGEPNGVRESKPPLLAEHIADFVKWLKQRFWRTKWRVEGTGGGDVSLSFLTVQYATIGMRDTARLDPNAQVRWYHAIAGGATAGWPEDMCVGGSFSTVDFYSAGTVLRAPWYRELSFDDFRGGIIVIELGLNILYLVGGGSGTLVIFGMGFPPSRVLAELDRFFRYGFNRTAVENLFFKAMPSGIAVFGGASLGIPGAGLAARVGYMSDLPAPWRRH